MTPATLGIHDLALFAATVLALSLTPGLDMLVTAGQTLRHGVGAGLATAFGVAAGCIVHTLAAAFGLAALLAASAAAFAVVKALGAAYMAWVAIGMLRAAVRRAALPQAASAAGGPPRKRGAQGARASFRLGLLTNVLNPKVALFFLALLPQFIAADASAKTLAFLALGGWMVLQNAVFFAVFVPLIARLRRFAGVAALRRGALGVGGMLFLGLAARLALMERSP